MTSFYRSIVAAGLAFGVVGAAHADNLGPVEAQSIDLGEVSGIAYYTVQQDGFHVVATLGQSGEGATPVRVETVLVPGQSVRFSTAHAVGVAPETVEFSRLNDQVVVHKAVAKS
jgi:hypothetical protein